MAAEMTIITCAALALKCKKCLFHYSTVIIRRNIYSLISFDVISDGEK